MAQSFKNRTRERDVQVVLEIEPKGSCFMEELEGDIADVELQFPNGECNCDVTVCKDDKGDQSIDIFHHSGEICENCPGIVFSEYGLVPHFLDRCPENFVVRSFLPSDNQLSELIDDLRRVAHNVRILRILDLQDYAVDSRAKEIDMSQLTDKQQDTLERAVERGYYESPPEVSLSELAGEFDISEAALSQRLARAERTVMGELFS
jgi:hypothetical protein